MPIAKRTTRKTASATSTRTAGKRVARSRAKPLARTVSRVSTRAKKAPAKNITARKTVVSLISFGFRYWTPASLELLFDVRFLPNPYFEESLRDGSGRDAAVAKYVLDSERGRDFFGRLDEFVRYLLPFYDEEGKAYVTIAIGCTGGRHRSVAFVEAIATRLREVGREVSIVHRDVDRPN